MRFDLVLLLTALFCNVCASIDPINANCSIVECVNSGNIDTSSAILCNDCMAKILSNKDTSLLLREIQQRLTNNDNQISITHPRYSTKVESGSDNFDRTKLADLNADVLFLIFDELHILDTLNLLKAYPDETLSAVAAADFRRKYKCHTINIDAYPQSSDVGTYRTIEVNAHSIAVFQLKITKNLLKHFGAVIERLTIKSFFEPFSTRFYVFSTLSQWIYKYAGRSLKCLDLSYMTTDMVVHFNQPFVAVEELAIKNYRLSKQQKTLETKPLHELFPRLHKLQMELHPNMNYSFIYCNFPHLEILQMEITEGTKNEVLDAFLSKNTQIKSIEMTFLSKDICDIINNNLPNLECLKLRQISHVNDTHFKWLKNFEINSINNEQIKRLSLPLLQTLNITYNPRVGVEWIPFFHTHKNITRLKISRVYGRDSHQIIQMIRNISNLIEVMIEEHFYFGTSNFGFTSEIINGTITRGRKLEKFSLLTYNLTEHELNTIREQIKNDWMLFENRHQLHRIDGVILSFEKKKK